jgi:hypothetical protein
MEIGSAEHKKAFNAQLHNTFHADAHSLKDSPEVGG